MREGADSSCNRWYEERYSNSIRSKCLQNTSSLPERIFSRVSFVQMCKRKAGRLAFYKVV
jgi:hypothetical protein